MPELLFFLIAFLAEVIGTMAGFGSSTLFIPAALLFFDFPVALALGAFFHMFGNAGRLAFFRGRVDRRILLAFGLPSAAFTLAGALLVSLAPQVILKALLGAFLIFFSVHSLLKPDFAVKASVRNCAAGGAITGFLAGLIGAAGALRGAFLTSFRLEKSTYIATIAAISLTVDFMRVPVYLLSGFVPNDLLYLLPILFAIAIAGSFTGRQIVGRIDQKTFRKLVLAAIALAGAKLALDGLGGL